MVMLLAVYLLFTFWWYKRWQWIVVGLFTALGLSGFFTSGILDLTIKTGYSWGLLIYLLLRFIRNLSRIPYTIRRGVSLFLPGTPYLFKSAPIRAGIVLLLFVMAWQPLWYVYSYGDIPFGIGLNSGDVTYGFYVYPLKFPSWPNCDPPYDMNRISLFFAKPYAWQFWSLTIVIMLTALFFHVRFWWLNGKKKA